MMGVRIESLLLGSGRCILAARADIGCLVSGGFAMVPTFCLKKFIMAFDPSSWMMGRVRTWMEAPVI